eukprot:6187355-Pleurochrysis_carterae.AAC.2
MRNLRQLCQLSHACLRDSERAPTLCVSAGVGAGRVSEQAAARRTAGGRARGHVDADDLGDAAR